MKRGRTRPRTAAAQPWRQRCAWQATPIQQGAIPSLGQDEDYVFGELLGLTAAQRADLESREVIL